MLVYLVRREINYNFLLLAILALRYITLLYYIVTCTHNILIVLQNKYTCKKRKGPGINCNAHALK